MDNNKQVNSIGWTILGIIGGVAIITASAVISLIKNKKDIITEKQKELIGFSVMFSEFIKQGKQNITDETKKIEGFLKDKIYFENSRSVICSQHHVFGNQIPEVREQRSEVRIWKSERTNLKTASRNP